MFMTTVVARPFCVMNRGRCVRFVRSRQSLNVRRYSVKGIEPYVDEVTNTFEITKGSLPPDVKPDPMDPDLDNLQEPYSAFDYVGAYDGEGHTIDTNGLAEAYRAVVGAGFAVSYAVGESGAQGLSALVALDATKITSENVAVTYGVSNLDATSIPTAERTIELYVRKRVNPTTGKEAAAGVDDFVGYVSWTSGGETSYQPVVAGAQAVSLAKAALRAPAPMKLAAVNTALAVGSAIAEGSSPYCRLTKFAVSDNEITGVVEVGSISSDGSEYPGKHGPNATVTLLETNDLGVDFKEICAVTTDSEF